MAIVLNQSKLSFTEWLQKITLNEKFVPDDLTIYCLSRFLNVHTLVYTKDFCWSTLLKQFKMDQDELYSVTFVWIPRDTPLVATGLVSLHHRFRESHHTTTYSILSATTLSTVRT